MPEIQEVVIPHSVRQELASRVHQMLREEVGELDQVRKELKAATNKRTRTAGWRAQEARSRRRVEVLTALLGVLQTGRFFPPAGSSLPRVVLLGAITKLGLLEQGLSFAKAVYQKVIEVQAEIRATLRSV